MSYVARSKILAAMNLTWTVPKKCKKIHRWSFVWAKKIRALTFSRLACLWLRNHSLYKCIKWITLLDSKSKDVWEKGASEVKLDVICQTRRWVFHWISKHWKVGQKKKKEAQPSFLNQLRSVWIFDETLFRVFDIASQTIDNSWRK